MPRALAEFLTRFGGAQGKDLVGLLQGENVDYTGGEMVWDGKLVYNQGTNRLMIGGDDITEALAEVFAEALKSPDENSWVLNLFQFFKYQQDAGASWQDKIAWPGEEEALPQAV